VVSFLYIEGLACRAFPLYHAHWTDLTHGPCQHATRLGAPPPWWGASRPAMCAAGGGGADHLGRRCRHIDTCCYAGRAEGVRGHVTPLAASLDLHAQVGL